MTSSCRGILIAGVTNRARTQMAEGILRHLTSGALFIKSGGIHHEATVHPLALKVMGDIGIDIRGQSVSSLASARRQRMTYDVYISIDDNYETKSTDKSLPPTGAIQRRPLMHAVDANNTVGSDCIGSDSDHQEIGHLQDVVVEEEEEVCYDPMLVPSTPSHWTIGADSTDAHRRWHIWSPRDPKIFHETSTRKFQDHLYEGEPLFMQLDTSYMRTRMKISERWEMDEISTRYVVEGAASHEARFVQARDKLLRLSMALIQRMEKFYGENLLVNKKVAERVLES